MIGATAITATVTDASAFKSGREFAAWVGLVPRQYSTGGKQKLGGISKQGDRYLRRLLIVGATTVIRHARAHPEKESLDHEAAGQDAGQEGRRGARQQDGTNRLGAARQRRNVSPAESAVGGMRGPVTGRSAAILEVSADRPIALSAHTLVRS